MARRFSALQKLVALAPLVLLVLCLPGQMMFRCRIDGTLRQACCCTPDGETQDAGPVVRAQDCCDRQVVQSARSTFETTRAVDRDLAWTALVATVAAGVALPAPRATGPDWSWQRHGPARERPPIVLLKHAFLI